MTNETKLTATGRHNRNNERMAIRKLELSQELATVRAERDALKAACMGIDDAWAGNGDMATAVDAVLLALAQVSK